VLILRLKQCECCLSDGRLDEAFELARQGDFRAHRRGQRLVGRLVPALIARGCKHLAAGQLSQASADCEKAAYLAGNQAEIAQLRIAVARAMQSLEKVRAANGQAIAAARRHADLGHLTVGQQILDAVNAPDARVDGLKHDLAARRAAVESSCRKSSAALADGDWHAAIDHLVPLGRGAIQDGAVRQLCGQISDRAVEEIDAAIQSGRLDVAASLLRTVERLPVHSVECQARAKGMEDFRAAHAAIEAGRPHEAEPILRRLQRLLPRADWLTEAAQEARKMSEGQSALRSGPLSLAAAAARLQITTPPPIPTPPPLPGHFNQAAHNGDQKSFCLHVDGIGSFEVFTSSTISIGPISSSRSVDLPLMLDAAVPAIRISRSDEDYFLQASRPVLINDSPATSRLLHNGDRIGLGSRCRITFRRPSAASTSALLDLSGVRVPGSSIRQVVLLDRELIIGPGAAAHIRCDEMAAPVTLQKRGEGILCRSAAQIAIDGNPAGQAADVPMNANVSVGSLRFVIVREQRS